MTFVVLMPVGKFAQLNDQFSLVHDAISSYLSIASAASVKAFLAFLKRFNVILGFSLVSILRKTVIFACRCNANALIALIVQRSRNSLRARAAIFSYCSVVISFNPPFHVSESIIYKYVCQPFTNKKSKKFLNPFKNLTFKNL